MRIGLFTDCWEPTKNGVVTSLVQVREELVRRGHHVSVFTVAFPGHPITDDDVHECSSIPFDRDSETRIALRARGRFARLATGAGVDLIHTHTEFGVGRAGRRIAAEFGLPRVHTVHTIYDDYRHYLPAGAALPRRAIHRALRSFLTGADRVLAPSPRLVGYLAAAAPGFDPLVVPNGIDLERFAPRPELGAAMRRSLGIDEGEVVLLAVGRLGREKRVVPLVRALAPLLRKRPRARLLLVGDGPQRNAVERIAAATGLGERVTCAGPMRWELMPSIYAAADCLVAASLSEVHPVAALEAAASGLPIVARGDSAYAGIVEDGRTGLLARDDTSLAAAAARLIDDKGRRRTTGAAARRQALRFGVGRHVDALEQVYADVRSNTAAFRLSLRNKTS